MTKKELKQAYKFEQQLNVSLFQEFKRVESENKVMRDDLYQLSKDYFTPKDAIVAKVIEAYKTSDEKIFENIKKEGGLNPEYSKQSKGEKGIYLTDDKSVAENYAGFFDAGEKLVLLKIKTVNDNQNKEFQKTSHDSILIKNL